MAKRLSLLAAVAIVAALIVVSIATGGPGRNDLLAAMNGAQEVPTGDPNGFGAASVEIRRGNRVCFRIIVGGTAPATAGHIHRGRAGEAGPVVVPLFNGVVPRSTRCVRAPRSLVREILRRPARFYVNVHNAEFPEGAVRGQLSK